MKPTAISLFSGAGGLDLGIEAAGFQVIYAVENDATAVETLNINRQKHFRSLPATTPSDITATSPKTVMKSLGICKGELDLLVGGPPCVAFSKSGFHLEYKRKGLDPQADLLQDYLRFLEALKPRSYIIENVFGLAYRNQSAVFFKRLTDGLRKLKYSISYEVLNAADYGVPQNRQRLFIVGSRDGTEIKLPPPTHWGIHERRIRNTAAENLLPHRTSGDALRDLTTCPESEENINGKYGHLLTEIPPGGNYLHFTAKAGHQSPLFDWRSRYWTFLLKLDPNRPSSTVQGQPGPYVGPFHWENRRLRVPELKRLQSFPDDFTFSGSRRDVQLQIGNSVPPLLAQSVALAVKIQLGGGEVNKQGEQLLLKRL